MLFNSAAALFCSFDVSPSVAKGFIRSGGKIHFEVPTEPTPSLKWQEIINTEFIHKCHFQSTDLHVVLSFT